MDGQKGIVKVDKHKHAKGKEKDLVKEHRDDRGKLPGNAFYVGLARRDCALLRKSDVSEPTRENKDNKSVQVFWMAKHVREREQ